MRTSLALLIALCIALPVFAQDNRPDDATPDAVRAADEESEREGDAEQDDPTSRLEWQRQAWGVVTPAFRQNALKEGQSHSNKKNAPGPKWVNIGPTGADYEQNGSFTGHVRDSGR